MRTVSATGDGLFLSREMEKFEQKRDGSHGKVTKSERDGKRGEDMSV